MIPNDPTFAYSFLKEYLLNDILYEFPDEIYHYTNLPGVAGILESKTLWASNYLDLNDKSEIQYSLDLLVDRIEQKRKEGCDREIEKLLNNYIQEFHSYKHSDTFIVSFCHKYNDEYTWGEYGDKFKGGMISFNFRDMLARLPYPIKVFPVFYDMDIQKSLIDKLLDFIIKIFIERNYFVDAPKQYEFEYLLGRQFLEFLLPIFKEEKQWSDEKEIRIILLRKEYELFYGNQEDFINISPSGNRYCNIPFYGRISSEQKLLPISHIMFGSKDNSRHIQTQIEEQYDFIDFSVREE